MTESEHTNKRRLLDLFDGIAYGPKHVLTISDAEILALDGPGVRRITPLLSLDTTVSAQQRTLAADEAIERLRTVGRTEDGTPLGGPNTDDGEPTARTVLGLRRSWLCLLVINQESALGRHFMSLYLRADRRALVETATGDGQHRFSVMKRAAALDTAARELAPVARATDADARGNTYAVSTWQDDAHDMLEQAKIASTVISRRLSRTMDHQTDDRFAVYAFDDHTEILYPEAPEQVRITPIARHTLRDRLDTITAPIDDAEQVKQ